MITAKFTCIGGNFKIISIAGHAGCFKNGCDVVCAAVSSAVQMLVNGLNEILKLGCKVHKSESEIILVLGTDNPSYTEAGQLLLETFRLHMVALAAENEGAIKVLMLEE
ncbi:MAG: ribosomal-processing cysteine protease Prp [Oscillospiraceae bacterium]|jgi:uncharacterized protein YsxB (DUF464 family)|nr:ribosomal-processing cysteine protease Prp [Oscillospiraceae bacterium]